MDEQYGELIEPHKVPFSFGAPGWYVLGGILLLLCIALLCMIVRIYNRNLYRKKALQWIDEKIAHQPATILYDTNMLLKQVAMTKYERADVAAIRNIEWMNFLNLSMRKNVFNEADTQLLQRQLYTTEPDAATNIATNIFLNKAKQWIRKHRRMK